MRKALIYTLFVLFCISAAGAATAAVFGPNSADINNAYMYTKTGSQLIVGFGSKVFQYEYVHILGTDIVDGVKCIRGISISTQPSEFTEYWIAQDVGGDIYLLKYWRGGELRQVVLGKEKAELMATGSPQIGDLFFSDKTVVEVGVIVPRLTTGLGPFENCVKTRGPGGDFTYFARNIGMVKKVHPGGRSGWELKEIITAGKGRVLPKAPAKLKVE